MYNPTSLNSLECWGAVKFKRSTVGLWRELKLSCHVLNTEQCFWTYQILFLKASNFGVSWGSKENSCLGSIRAPIWNFPRPNTIADWIWGSWHRIPSNGPGFVYTSSWDIAQWHIHNPIILTFSPLESAIWSSTRPTIFHQPFLVGCSTNRSLVA